MKLFGFLLFVCIVYYSRVVVGYDCSREIIISNSDFDGIRITPFYECDCFDHLAATYIKMYMKDPSRFVSDYIENGGVIYFEHSLSNFMQKLTQITQHQIVTIETNPEIASYYKYHLSTSAERQFLERYSFIAPPADKALQISVTAICTRLIYYRDGNVCENYEYSNPVQSRSTISYSKIAKSMRQISFDEGSRYYSLRLSNPINNKEEVFIYFPTLRAVLSYLGPLDFYLYYGNVDSINCYNNMWESCRTWRDLAGAIKNELHPLDYRYQEMAHLENVTDTQITEAHQSFIRILLTIAGIIFIILIYMIIRDCNNEIIERLKRNHRFIFGF